MMQDIYRKQLELIIEPGLPNLQNMRPWQAFFISELIQPPSMIGPLEIVPTWFFKPQKRKVRGGGLELEARHHFEHGINILAGLSVY